jgi:hypothetical protein
MTVQSQTVLRPSQVYVVQTLVSLVAAADLYCVCVCVVWWQVLGNRPWSSWSLALVVP